MIHYGIRIFHSGRSRSSKACLWSRSRNGSDIAIWVQPPRSIATSMPSPKRTPARQWAKRWGEIEHKERADRTVSPLTFIVDKRFYKLFSLIILFISRSLESQSPSSKEKKANLWSSNSSGVWTAKWVSSCILSGLVFWANGLIMILYCLVANKYLKSLCLS